MRQGLSRLLPVFLVVPALGLAAVGCSEDPRSASGDGPSSDQTTVVTTLYPLEYFARRIAGDSVTVVNLVSPGGEAHDFEPSPGDIRKLDRADLILYSGSGFEAWIDRALSSIGRNGRIVVEAGRGLAQLPDGGSDPHIWLDPLGAIEQAGLIRDALTRADPAGAEPYNRNAASLIGDLEGLDSRYRSALESCRLRHFVTSHEAFGHLAGRYGLEQLSISGLAPEAEPSPGDLARLIDEVRSLGTKYVLVEPGGSRRLSETLAREVGADLLTLTPLEGLTADQSEKGETYFSLMESNLEALRTALECD